MERDLSRDGYLNQAPSAFEGEPSAQQEARAHQRRKDGVKYELRVIEGSGGLLELVEEPPKESWFHEWARIMYLMQRSGWGI